MVLVKFCRLSIGLLLGLLLGTLPVQISGASGPDLVNRLGCMACHSLNGVGGTRGPKWDNIGSRLTLEEFRKQLFTPQGRMPNYAHLQPEELQTLLDYLRGLK